MSTISRCPVRCTALCFDRRTHTGWRDSHYFREPEKAALEWAESLTHVDVTHAPDAAYEPLKRYYDDKQIANLTYAIALMNAWNRLAIGFQHAPPPRSGDHSA